MVDVLVILDGASEPLGAARRPRWSAPARRRSTRSRARARCRAWGRSPPGLPAGSEAAIPALLGWAPPAPVDRGALEAAARGIGLGPGERAWRVDVLGSDGRRAGAGETRPSRDVAGCRGAGARRAPHRRAPAADHRRAAAARGGARRGPSRVAAGRRPAARPRRPRRRDRGCRRRGRLCAAARRARGDPARRDRRPDTDLQAKAAAALAAIDGGAGAVVVHVGARRRGGTRRDAAAKVAALERDRRASWSRRSRARSREAGGTLAVCPDHGCDPVTGAHDDRPRPVPALAGPERARRPADRADACAGWPRAASSARLVAA